MMRRFVFVALIVSLLMVAGAGAAIASVPSVPRNTLSTNLVAHWRFEETSGTRYDELNGCGGSGCDFTSNNSVGYAAGKLGTNAEKTLSASNQYLSVASHSDLSLGSKSFTMCFWFSHTVGNYEAISKGTGNVSSSDYTFLIYDTSVVLYVGSATSASVSWAGGTAWHFVCGWHDLSNNQIGISIDDGTPVTASQSSNTAYGAALFVGSYASSSTNSTIDSLSFWSRKISAAEITQLYNSGSGCDYVSGAWTCEATATPTATNTAPPPTATNTPLPPTATNTPPPGATNTPTPLPPTATDTPLPATSTPTPLPPTATSTPTATPTSTPTATPTNTPNWQTVINLPPSNSVLVEYRVTTGDIAVTLVGALLLLVLAVYVLARIFGPWAH